MTMKVVVDNDGGRAESPGLSGAYYLADSIHRDM